MPSRSTPLSAVWVRDRSVEVANDFRSGETRLATPRRYRGRFKFEWTALDYETAHDIITRVSRHPVEVRLRLRQDEDVDFIKEISWPCRLLGSFPVATPAGRFDDTATGSTQKVGRLAVRLETIVTINKIEDLSTDSLLTAGGSDRITTANGFKRITETI